jgi:peptide-methionine (R)-S-oxide reductase
MRHTRESVTAVKPTRRQLLSGMSVLALASAMGWRRALATAMPAVEIAIENFSPSGQSLGVAKVDKIVKTDAEWKQQLSAESYDVTRHAGTERAGTGQYAYNHADGLYRCVCCATALFDSKTKFESGTGWPSFWAPISAHNVVTSSDHSFGMSRDAVACARCDAHLGHVFDDGPKPTGLRYCMNSASLNFSARA